MKSIALIFALLLTPLSIFAVETGVFELNTDHKVFYRYQQAQPGQPTIVLLNGLIYAIENWDDYFNELQQSGVGILQLAYSTQPESLAYLNGEPAYYTKPKFKPYYGPGLVQAGLETQTLIDETMAAVNYLKIEKFHVASLSYGSIVASQLAHQHIDRVQSLILMAPAVVTSGRYNPWGASRHQFYTFMRLNPFSGADYLYDAEIGNTMSWLITPQQYSFPNVDFNDFYSGVYQKARSSKWFDLKDFASEELPTTHLFVATLEDAPLLEDQKAFWKLMSTNPAKGSLVTFTGSYHAIPGVAPKSAAEQTLKAIRKQLPLSSSVNVGAGQPLKNSTNSLLDYSELSEDSWRESQQ